ncbi:bacillithiol biosynthesis deacetylase BshB1 [Roseimaritima ulvae]|uniref:1D-myo-inositol 2-acetamido-2-deoxy-alpha-D-glucopyranoside deacetylase n=1 Tax=Roseimaritima ulvae TaxID=980254 RepID=A0A5B9QRD9_9BACT|nr:bacillithiol biosynthesis deacetylase BshB1 [Roseimaritima ulvae]QEG41564.1 1D-myo-inositol 2-acetamido-2-deoxy-alpha-D-glucopyranoside deacetylase [Roseimaritima ulvae]
MDMLVIAPHPDDAELGMGGTIAKMISAGWEVGILDLTSGEPTPHGSEALRAEETAAASKALGVSWRQNAGLPNRSLQHTLEARAIVAGYIRQTRPRWLFAPYWKDAHPDHVVATELVEAARFWAKLSKTDLPGEPFHPERIYYYYCIHLRLAVQPSWIVDISEQWDRKLEAIRCFESQFITGRPSEPPTLLDRFRDDAAYWGRLINRRYGEPFATREPLAVTSLRDFF